jgi:hypothetical protein
VNNFPAPIIDIVYFFKSPLDISYHWRIPPRFLFTMKKQNTLGRRAATLSTLCLLTGCASIVSTNRYSVPVHGSPEGATVTVTDRRGNEVMRSTTPTVLPLSSENGFFVPATYRLNITKSGYAPVSRQVDANLNGWYLGNFIFGGVLGLLIIDPATGAMWRLDENPINYHLVPEAPQPVPTSVAPVAP